MNPVFFRAFGDDAKDKKGEPKWVVETNNRLTQQYIHKRVLHLIDVGRYEDVKAIQDEFILE